MSERKAKGCLAAALVWCVILVFLAVGYRFLVHPYFKSQLEGDTGSQSQYRDEIILTADSFSGYAILRSDPLRQALRAQKIKLTVRDDQADYAARLKSLRDGETDLAVFTIDTLISSGAALGDLPASIVLVIDETKGSDAIVAKRAAVDSIQALNRPEARFVLTPNSPSEFLARVVMAHFNLPDLPKDWIVPAEGSAEVFDQLRRAGASEKRAFVLWEPYVTQALELPDVHVLLDSSRLRGYIVDVLVAQREFLRDHPDKVRTFVEAYLRAAYAFAQQPDGMSALVREDARRTGAETLSEEQARRIVAGIDWKNTLENYAHFGLLPEGTSQGLQYLEDIIGNIVDVLVQTRAIASDPVDGKHHTVFYRQLLADLREADFHPGRDLNVIQGLGPGLEGVESISGPGMIQPLTEAQWQSLQPVGELKVVPIVFMRGSARLSSQSERHLADLAKRLESFPNFYLRIIGRTRSEGDPDANRRLAESRAAASADYLRRQGVLSERLRTEAAPESAQSGAGQAVSFEVGQPAY